MISKIDNRSGPAANIIHGVLHDAYIKEAALIEVDDFPPLQRTVDEVMASDNQFYAYRRDGTVCGIIELEPLLDRTVDGTLIASLGVSPHAFRNGIGRALVKHALHASSGKVVVSTSDRNKPAIRLYESEGFTVLRRYTPTDGTTLVELKHQNR